MRALTVVLCVALAACSGQTAPGPVGRPLDLRQYLPDSLRATVPQSGDSTFRQQIRVGPDSAPVELTWTAVVTEKGRYLTSIGARLLAAARYDSLTVGDISDLRNVGSRWTPIEEGKVRVGWFKRVVFRKAGLTTFIFDAAGKGTVLLSGPPLKAR